MLPHYFILPLLLILASLSYAEDASDDDDYDDLDFDFSIQQKSTLEDFPMQEIDQEALSNTAVAGALTTHAALQSKKPAYKEKDDENEKLLKAKGDKKNTENELAEIKEMLKYSETPIIAPQFEAPIYNTPNGRVYTELNRHTVERY